MDTQARLIVDVARLDEGGEQYTGELAESVLDIGKSEVLRPVGGIHYDLFVQQLGTELLVRGTLRQELECVCVRCGKSFTSEAEEPEFTESFEIKPETEFMDLTEAVRQAIILALPGYPVCKESCKGLCMKCGANLNNGPCKCTSTGGQDDSRWGALDALTLPETLVAKDGKKAPDRGKRGRKPPVKEK